MGVDWRELVRIVASGVLRVGNESWGWDTGNQDEEELTGLFGA